MAKPETEAAAAAAATAATAAAVAAATPPASAAKPPKVAKPVEVRNVPPLTVARWSEAQFKQARHAVTPEAGTRVEDLGDPAYFAHVAPKMNAGDIIEVRPADGAFYAELYIWSKGPSWLQTSLLKRLDRPGPAAVPSAVKGFSIEFVEGDARHRIVRDTDRAELVRGFDTPAAANAWLEANKLRIAA